METTETTVEGRIAEDIERAQAAETPPSLAHPDPLADLPQQVAEEVRRLQPELDARELADHIVRQIRDAKNTKRPVPVMDTITLKWFCSCGAQAVGTFTPPIYEVIAVVWDMHHTGPDARGFEHYLTTEAICKEARHRGNRPPFSVQLTLDSLTRL